VIRYTPHVRFVQLGLALLLASTLLGSLAAAEQSDEQTLLRGHVVASEPVIQHVDETVKLIGEDGKTWELIVEADNYHALHDKQLAGRLWELTGYDKGEGRFEVRQMFTIKDGERHKVTYYCQICHIVSYRPGQCMCCQEEVELRETVYDGP